MTDSRVQSIIEKLLANETLINAADKGEVVINFGTVNGKDHVVASVKVFV